MRYVSSLLVKRIRRSHTSGVGTHGNDVELAKTIADAPVSNLYDFDGGINHAYFGGSDNKSKTSLLLKEMQKKLAIRNESDEDESSDDDDDDDTSDGKKYDGESDSDIEREETAHLRRNHFGWRLQSTSSITVLPNRRKYPRTSRRSQKVKVALDFLKETTKDNNVRDQQRDEDDEAGNDTVSRILVILHYCRFH